MQVAIVHYHLNRGGVTQVIKNHLRSLSRTHRRAERLRVVIFFGGRREGWPEEEVQRDAGVKVQLETVPDLEYASSDGAGPVELAESLLAAFQRSGLHPDDTVVHVHNHALGKNPSLPGAVAELSERGFALLLQLHDFAEDFRPDNYRSLAAALAPRDPDRLAERIYPQGAAIHYAVLNDRDYRILAAAGVESRRLHLLPNPVPEFPVLPEREPARAKLAERYGVGTDQVYVLYPVRGIRRKNLGELLLWSAVAAEQTRFALTLPPLNPVERPRYLAWKRLAGELNLPVIFEVGAEGGLGFGENLVAADRVLTTSVAEGFGMVFLETWLANRPLIGRDLPEITEDFVATGVRFPQLSEMVNVPMEWVGAEEVKQDLQESYASVLDAYGQFQLDRDLVGHEVSQLVSGDLLDFARCSARLQEFIVARVAGDPRRQTELRELNPNIVISMEQLLEAGDRCVSSNARIVRDHYSLEPSGAKLQQLYETVLHSPRSEIDSLPRGSLVLDTFLSPRRFHPIRIH